MISILFIILTLSLDAVAELFDKERALKDNLTLDENLLNRIALMVQKDPNLLNQNEYDTLLEKLKCCGSRETENE